MIDGFTDHGHTEFTNSQRGRKVSLLGEGYTFVGHLRPPKYAGRSYDEQEADLRLQHQGATFASIGDCSEATRSGQEGTTLEYTDGWVAVYAQNADEGL